MSLKQPFKKAFGADLQGLSFALERLMDQGQANLAFAPLPEQLPANGIGATEALTMLAPRLLEGAADFSAPEAFANMDPPTPWVTWAVTLWTASKNQNLLHPATAPQARMIEEKVINWLAPVFGMDGGHMVPGSTLANLTALWAARKTKGVRRVLASEGAHLSIRKAADILGLDYQSIATNDQGVMDAGDLPADMSDCALVLTAGTTILGAIDDLRMGAGAGWLHLDAAWAGPLILSQNYKHLLDRCERADSVAFSAHKWLFQPKESAVILFKDTKIAHQAMTYGSAYLAAPNIGILGSHGATAAPLLATLLAYGQMGIADWIDQSMTIAKMLADAVRAHPDLMLCAEPVSGVVVWGPVDEAKTEAAFSAMSEGSVSKTHIHGRAWLRNVAANPMADGDMLSAAISAIRL